MLANGPETDLKYIHSALALSTVFSMCSTNASSAFGKFKIEMNNCSDDGVERTCIPALTKSLTDFSTEMDP
jgi:hypothetical protein